MMRKQNLMANANLEAKAYELYGAGFGVLNYNNDPLDLVSEFRDSGQPALGQPIDVMTINDRRPRCIIPPMAVSSGTIQFTTYALKSEGLWGTVFNGKFKNAQDLVDLFTQQLNDGAITVSWVTVDLKGEPTKLLMYHGVVVTNAQRNVVVTNSGATQATQTFTCKYTRTTWQTKNN